MTATSRLATVPLLAFTHEYCSAHRPIWGHPERPERLEAALAGARRAGAQVLSADIDEVRALAAVARVHDPALAGRLEAACRGATPALFDCADNPISAGTYGAALAAVGVTLAGVDAVVEGRARVAWVNARPPGHHALRGRAMGFCFFNNAAIAAEEFLARGFRSVVVVDIDVHHGNGTQNHFWARRDVFYLSVHRYPFYPGSGAGDETGVGEGQGFTRNFPLAAGASDDVYAGALTAGLEDVMRITSPDAWVISAGFDAHLADPLGGMAVTSAGYETMGLMLRGAVAGKPVVAVLEGGYQLSALVESVHAFLSGLVGSGDA
jgi:acetoin utilization deacetylase AcuC-like enzyme